MKELAAKYHAEQISRRCTIRNFLLVITAVGILFGFSGCTAPAEKTDNFSMIQLPGGLVGIEMVKIKAGTFKRYSDKDEKFYLAALTNNYWIGKYEVTQMQFEALMGYNPSSDTICTGLNNPVNQVSYAEAENFCRKLNLLYKDKLPAGYQFALPTVAQWEYACCVGRDMASESKYYNDTPSIAGWTYTNSPETVQPVGLKKPNRWGLHDMHGNVSEWCRDFYQEDMRAYDIEYLTGNKGQMRTVCGWSIFHDQYNFDRLDRCGAEEESRKFNLGFRLALVPAKTQETVTYEDVSNDIYDYANSKVFNDKKYGKK